MSAPTGMRITTDLSQDWRYLPDLYHDGVREGYAAPGFDDRAWRQVSLPCLADAVTPELASFRGGIWFRRMVSSMQGDSACVQLHIGGVVGRSQVYWDGMLVHEDRDCFLPITIDLTGRTAPDRPHCLVIHIDNTCHPEDIPGQRLGWDMPCGIIRSVQLVTMAASHLDAVRVTAGCEGSRGMVHAEVVANADAQLGLQAELTVRSRDGRVCGTPICQTVLSGRPTRIEAAIPDIMPWSPESPALYDVEIRLLENGHAIDTVRRRIGFRSISWSREGLFINGRLIYLLGFNRHEDTPESGMVENPGRMREDLRAMKAMGCNFIRLAHYPHAESTLDLCDELGMLVLEEVPVYWWGGSDDETSRQILEAGKRQLIRLIDRDRHHPSTIIWSVSNETTENLPHIIRGNAELIRHARACDSTRPITHVSTATRITPETSIEDDVLCINDYPGIEAVKRAKYTPQAAEAYWPTIIASLRALYPNTPIVVTEFGYPALHGIAGGTAGEVRQAECLAAEYAGIRRAESAGAVVWCWADHPWPKAMDQELRTSPYGVVTRSRSPKAAAENMRACFLSQTNTNSGKKSPPQTI